MRVLGDPWSQRYREKGERRRYRVKAAGARSMGGPAHAPMETLASPSVVKVTLIHHSWSWNQGLEGAGVIPQPRVQP